MAYFLNLFSPETWANFQAAGGHVSGFSKNQETQARRHIKPGDVFLCYMVKLGRWCGALRITEGPYLDSTPLFREGDDPFVVRFKVEPIVALPPELSLPVAQPEIWDRLTITRDIERGSVGWGANFQRSLRSISAEDGDFLLAELKAQAAKRTPYSFSAKDERHLRSTMVRTAAGEVSVQIPDDEEVAAASVPDLGAATAEYRESHKVQALLAELGAKMGFKVWLPKNDRERVQKAADFDFRESLVDLLPMNYNEATVRTIEQIDVLWLRGRSIARAFEVEHTTAIYSGLLRMADLVALQPDIQIPLHIVAPEERTAAVLEQIRRPVFSLLDTGPLSDRCSLITYDAIREIAALPHVQHLNDSIIGEYQVEAES